MIILLQMVQSAVEDPDGVLGGSLEPPVPPPPFYKNIPYENEIIWSQ